MASTGLTVIMVPLPHWDWFLELFSLLAEPKDPTVLQGLKHHKVTILEVIQWVRKVGFSEQVAREVTTHFIQHVLQGRWLTCNECCRRNLSLSKVSVYKVVDLFVLLQGEKGFMVPAIKGLLSSVRPCLCSCRYSTNLTKNRVISIPVYAFQELWTILFSI